ncbi:MAG: polyamine aminopropyltransferase [Limnochordia bacterium]
MLEVWFHEKESDHLHVGHRITKVLYQGCSEYQEIAVIDTVEFGRMLVLDGIAQLSLRDEFVYHEMLAHVPLFTHPNPKRVLVIGGGDGGTMGEVIKHSEVEEAHLVEIDGQVIEVCREFLPQLARSLDDPRVTVHVADGIRFMKEQTAAYDVILVDSTDPLGPSEGLFTVDFYADAARALRDDGVLAVQSESPFFTPELVQDVYRAIDSCFPQIRLYMATVPIYSLAPWSFTMGSKKPQERMTFRRVGEAFATRYYSSEIHEASFCLPPYVKELLAEREA